MFSVSMSFLVAGKIAFAIVSKNGMLVDKPMTTGS
jgi:hypothetical protein